MIRTLPVLLGALLLSHSSSAQVVENFENGMTSFTNSSWQFKNVQYAQKNSDPNYVIAGNGGIYSNPPVNNTNYRAITSPFLDFTSNTIPVSFQYKLSSPLQKGATRVIEIGAIDPSGHYTFFDRIFLNEKSSTNTKSYSGEKPVSLLPAPGAYQLVIKMGGQYGDENCRILLDDLKIGAAYHRAGIDGE